MTRTKKFKREGLLKTPASVKPAQLPAPPQLSSLPVKKAQVSKAVQALTAHLSKSAAKKQENELISQDEHVFLVVTLKQMDSKVKTMPIRIPLPHSLVELGQTQVCLFCKDPQREYKDLLQDKNISYIQRVVGVDKLKGKFKAFEARRELMNSYDVFLADDRIIPLLPKLLGKKWIEEKKRQPTPVRLTRDDLAAELKTALGSTNLLLNRGTCMTIKVGTHDVHDSSQLIDNILAVVPYLAVRLPKGGWENVQALHIKSSTSLSLPIWSCDLSTERFDQTKPDPATQLSVLPSNLADDDENDDDGDEEADVEEIDESELKAIKKDAAKEGGGAAAGAKRKRGSATTGGKLESNKEQSPAKKVKGEAKPESTPRGGDKVKKRRSSAGKSKA